MKKIFRSIAVIFLTLILASQMAACRPIPIGDFGRYSIAWLDEVPGGGGSSAREDIPFSSLSYERPDTQEIRDAIDALKGKITAGGDAQELVAEYQEVLQMYDHLDFMSSLAYIYYSQDVTETYYDEEYQYLVGEMDEIDLPLTDLTILMFESGVTKDAMRDTFGTAFEDKAYLSKKRNSEAIQDDLKRFNELSSQYDTMLSTFKMTYEGREYTEEDLINSYTGDYDAYVNRVNAYYDQMNEKIGPLYLELVQVNCRIARTLGYDSFTEYQYEGYQRDYSPDEARKIHQAVKDYVVPAYTWAYSDFYYYSSASLLADGPTMSFDEFRKKLEPAIRSMGTDMSEPFNYMMKNGLMDRDVNPNKMKTSYTIYLADPPYPFIFTQWENDTDSCSTVIHEFGHFANYFMNPHVGWNREDPLDICEIDSQGLEMIMMKNYEDFYGSRYADPVRGANLLDAMYVVISGCMEDEFQQEVYANPDMTLEEMNQLYARLAEEYGFNELFPYTGTEWVAIPHTFQSPLYYFSYAASILVALEIWEVGLENPRSAENTYMEIQHRPADSSLRELATECGLSDPISVETVRSLSETISDWMDRFY